MHFHHPHHLGAGVIATALFVVSLAAGPSSAQSETQSQVVSLRSTDLTRPHERARAQARIEEAAYSVCGAPWGSSRAVRDDVRRSRCWRDAVAAATAQLDRRARRPPAAVPRP